MKKIRLILLLLCVVVISGCSPNYFDDDRYMCQVVDKEYKEPYTSSEYTNRPGISLTGGRSFSTDFDLKVVNHDEEYILYLDIWDLEDEKLVRSKYSKNVSKSVYDSYEIGDTYEGN